MKTAFIVIPNSAIWNNYWAQKEEQTKFKHLTDKFLDDVGIDSKDYAVRPALTVKLSKKEIESFSNQLLKNQDGEMCTFKRNSKIQRGFEKQVVSNIDTIKLHANMGWNYNIGVYTGRCSLIDFNGIVYGLVESNFDIELKSSQVKEIELSDYHSIFNNHE